MLRAGQRAGAGSTALTQAARRAAEEATAGDAVAEGRASLAQLSTWRHANPRARARGGSASGGGRGTHPALDLLHPLLVCLEDLEMELLEASDANQGESHPSGSRESYLAKLQQVTCLAMACASCVECIRGTCMLKVHRTICSSTSSIDMVHLLTWGTMG